MDHQIKNKTPNKFDGTVDQVKGAIKIGAGKLTGNTELQNSGKIDSVSGKAETKLADLKEKAKSAVHQVGDAIEHVGEKLTEKGFPKAGEAVRKVGDKLT